MFLLFGIIYFLLVSRGTSNDELESLSRRLRSMTEPPFFADVTEFPNGLDHAPNVTSTSTSTHAPPNTTKHNKTQEHKGTSPSTPKCEVSPAGDGKDPSKTTPIFVWKSTKDSKSLSSTTECATTTEAQADVIRGIDDEYDDDDELLKGFMDVSVERRRKRRRRKRSAGADKSKDQNSPSTDSAVPLSEESISAGLGNKEASNEIRQKKEADHVKLLAIGQRWIFGSGLRGKREGGSKARRMVKVQYGKPFFEDKTSMDKMMKENQAKEQGGDLTEINGGDSSCPNEEPASTNNGATDEQSLLPHKNDKLVLDARIKVGDGFGNLLQQMLSPGEKRIIIAEEEQSTEKKCDACGAG